MPDIYHIKNCGVEIIWNTAICDNRYGPWECYVKQNVSQKQLRTIWFHLYVGHKTETHGHRQQGVGYQRKACEQSVVKGKGGKYTVMIWLWWWAHNAVPRSCVIEMCTCNLYNLITQSHPKMFNLRKWKRLGMLVKLNAMPYKSTVWCGCYMANINLFSWCINVI